MVWPRYVMRLSVDIYTSSLGGKDGKTELWARMIWAEACNRQFHQTWPATESEDRKLDYHAGFTVVRRLCIRYAGIMGYPEGGGLAARNRARREAVRLRAAEMFAQNVFRVEAARRLRVLPMSAGRRLGAWSCTVESEHGRRTGTT